MRAYEAQLCLGASVCLQTAAQSSGASGGGEGGKESRQHTHTYTDGLLNCVTLQTTRQVAENTGLTLLSAARTSQDVV